MRTVVPEPETDRPIAFLSAADLNTTGFKLKDVCEFDLTVRPRGPEARHRHHAL